MTTQPSSNPLTTALTSLRNLESEAWVTLRESEADALDEEIARLQQRVTDLEANERAAVEPKALPTRVRLTMNVYDHGQDHHPPGYCGRKGDVVEVRSVESLAVAHEGCEGGFIVHRHEFEAVTTEPPRACCFDAPEGMHHPTCLNIGSPVTRAAEPPSVAADAARLRAYFDNANCISHPSLFYSSADPFKDWCDSIDWYVQERAAVTKSDESSPKGVQHGLAHREDETGPVPGEGETCPVCERSVIEDGVCARCDYRPESGEGIAP